MTTKTQPSAALTMLQNAPADGREMVAKAQAYALIAIADELRALRELIQSEWSDD